VGFVFEIVEEDLISLYLTKAYKGHAQRTQKDKLKHQYG